MRRFACFLATIVVAASATTPAVGAAPDPNDAGYDQQWGLRAIEAERAWTRSVGRDVVVAIVDTGVDDDHPDLAGRVLAGYDFADEDEDADDDNGHGTLIAGIVAARTGNRIGVASVAPQALILPVRVLGAKGSGSSSSVARGIRFAVEEGASVINLSLAQESGLESSGSILPSNVLSDPSVDDAITDAAEAGATVVVAAGNIPTGGNPRTAYDARVPGVIVVGASTINDRRAAYSNYGQGLDLLAPGGGTASDPSDESCTERNGIVSTYWNPSERRAGYGAGCGTSMAVGFVSGVAALLHSRGFTNRQAVSRILRTADDIGTAGRDEQTGAGRLNAARAVGAAASVRAQPIPRPSGSRASVAPRSSVHVQQGDPPRNAGSIAGDDGGRPRGGTDVATPLAVAMAAGMTAAHAIRAAGMRRRARA